RALLGDELIGIYLHGSLAMNSFNPVSSDIDFLIVVKDQLSLADKREDSKILIELSDKAPAKGFEMSVITLGSLKHFKYPTPYELHFANSIKQDFEDGKVDFATNKTDPDLAAHFVITRARGVALYGPPVIDIFPDVPKKYYLQSIASDAEWSFNDVTNGPDGKKGEVSIYAVLNFCRVLAFINQGLICSKREGGEWALQHLPIEYAQLIQESLKEYAKTGIAEPVEISLLKQFARYAWDRIHNAL